MEKRETCANWVGGQDLNLKYLKKYKKEKKKIKMKMKMRRQRGKQLKRAWK